MPFEAGSREELVEHFPFIEGGENDRGLTDSLFRYNWQSTRRGWWALFLFGLAGSGMMLFAIVYTVAVGIGVWGNQIPVAWAFGITNFVWWIGIGHAGTLISAILLLFQARWRTSINRFAEAMTLFAVLCAGIFPVLHTGRPWFVYWLIPYPSTLGIWPQFKSPLVWDVFAVSTYLTVSFLFWYTGLVPDLAAIRDASTSRARRIVYGIFALGWRGTGRGWNNYQSAYLLLAGLSTPLVLSVHTIVSFDFAVSLVNGWHETVFPPYFVAGAIFSGFAMVMTLIIPARRFLRLGNVITMRHLENMNKFMLAMSFLVAYGYVSEQFMAWYGGDPYERATYVDRAVGAYRHVYWLLVFCNVLAPQIFWWRRARLSLATMWIVALLINVGMWCERFIIIIQSLTVDYIPSSWRLYSPTWVDITLFSGTICFFLTLFLLFLRFVPAVPVDEVKELRHELHEEEHAAATGDAP